MISFPSWHFAILVAPFLLLINLEIVSSQTNFAVWTLPSAGDIPADPSTADKYPPPGCTCVDTEDTPCRKYECRCICNIRAGACDANCCCDTECTADEIASFQALDSCSPEGPANATLRKCVDLTSNGPLAEVNPKFRMELLNQDGFDSVMCIVVDNNPVVGEFFTDPVSAGQTSLDSSILDSNSVVTSNPDFNRFSDTFSQQASVFGSTSTSYEIGQRVRAAISTGGSLQPFTNGLLSLPDASVSTQTCLFDRIIRFRMEQQPYRFLRQSGITLGSRQHETAATGQPVMRSVLLERVEFTNEPSLGFCYADIELTTEGCAIFSTDTFVNNMRIGQNPAANPNTASGYISVTTNNIYSQSATTGTVTTLGSLPTTSLSTSGTTCTCDNVVSEVIYSIRYGTDNSISAVEANLVTTSVSGTCGESVALPFASATTFIPETYSQTDASFKTNNIVARQRSGQPGYLLGTHVNAGLLVNVDADTEAITALTQGLHVRGPLTGGACDSSGSMTASNAIPIRFGQDMAFGCSISLTKAQLQTLCQSTSIPQEFGLDTSVVSHIGALGNSDPIAPWQWLSLSFPSSASSTTYDSDTATCSGLATGIYFQFLTARLGERQNPQHKIVAARVQLLTDTWTHRGLSSSSEQQFHYTTLVSWAELPDQSLETFVPPPPQVLPKLPRDLFYPFQITSDNGGTTVSFASLSASRPSLFALLGLLLAVLAMYRPGLDR